MLEGDTSGVRPVQGLRGSETNPDGQQPLSPSPISRLGRCSYCNHPIREDEENWADSDPFGWFHQRCRERAPL